MNFPLSFFEETCYYPRLALSSLLCSNAQRTAFLTYTNIRRLHSWCIILILTTTRSPTRTQDRTTAVAAAVRNTIQNDGSVDFEPSDCRVGRKAQPARPDPTVPSLCIWAHAQGDEHGVHTRRDCLYSYCCCCCSCRCRTLHGRRDGGLLLLMLLWAAV